MGQQHGEVPMRDHRELVAQVDEAAVVREHRVRVVDLRVRVDVGGVGVDRDPRLARGEAGPLGRVPLHRRAGVVAALRPERGEDARGVVAPPDCLGPVIERIHVAELVDGGPREVRHPELFALVDVRRPAVQVEHGGEQLRRPHAVLGIVRAEAGDCPRLVVVIPVEAVPAPLGQAGLPAAQ
jgi:hypothetical protein